MNLAGESSVVETDRGAEIRKLSIVFAGSYICQGFCQYSSLINQPLKFYLNKGLSYSPVQAAGFMFYVTLPWSIKPVYGLISDFFPLLGYHRRSYLLVLNLLVAMAFLCVAGVHDPRAVLIAIVITGIGVAASDVIADAIMVEAGQRHGMTRRFQAIQWTSFYCTLIVAALLGAWIVGSYSPAEALAVAAGICVVPPLLFFVSNYFYVREKRTRLSVAQVRETAGGVWAAAKSGPLWLAILFLCLMNFNPAGSTVYYYHFVNHVGMSESFMSLTDALNGGGCVIGALIFWRFLGEGVRLRTTLIVGILAFAVAYVPFLYVHTPLSIGAGYVVSGVGNMIGNLSTFSLAAIVCPKRAEAVTFASLMAAGNFASNYSDVVGADLYEKYFNQSFPPLLWISIGITLLGLLFVPFLRQSAVEPEVSAEVALGVV